MKKTLLFTSIFLSLIIISSVLSPCIKMSEDISEKVFRLHILANSDEDYDQNLKLKVRDEILKLSEDIYKNCSSVDDAIEIANSNLNRFKDTAKSVIKANGYSYDVKVFTAKEYFNTRHYNGFTLPAGIYNSLKIEIGEAKGHNWWCVMFPSVCISGCVSDFEDTLSNDEIEMIKSDKYIIRFKTVEIIEKIKNIIN